MPALSGDSSNSAVPAVRGEHSALGGRGIQGISPDGIGVEALSIDGIGLNAVNESSNEPAINGSSRDDIGVFGFAYTGEDGVAGAGRFGATGLQTHPNGAGVMGVISPDVDGGLAGRFVGPVLIQGDLTVQGFISKLGGGLKLITHSIAQASTSTTSLSSH